MIGFEKNFEFSKCCLFHSIFFEKDGQMFFSSIFSEIVVWKAISYIKMLHFSLFFNFLKFLPQIFSLQIFLQPTWNPCCYAREKWSRQVGRLTGRLRSKIRLLQKINLKVNFCFPCSFGSKWSAMADSKYVQAICRSSSGWTTFDW